MDGDDSECSSSFAVTGSPRPTRSTSARTRILFALWPILDGQGTVSVHVTDENGPRGALERCSIRINGSELDVHVVAVDEDARRAVDLACSRAAAYATERRQANRVA